MASMSGSHRERPHHPGPLLPASLPVRREKREKFVGETLVGESFKSFFIPLLSRRPGREAGREGGRGL